MPLWTLSGDLKARIQRCNNESSHLNKCSDEKAPPESGNRLSWGLFDPDLKEYHSPSCEWSIPKETANSSGGSKTVRGPMAALDTDVQRLSPFV
jgi:hypothetical protein